MLSASVFLLTILSGGAAMAQEFQLVKPSSASPRDVSRDPFLRPYVEQLKKETPPAELDRISAMAEDELILLLHGYGTWMRNKWLHGNRDPSLLAFFRKNGYREPEGMSMALIEALWVDLNGRLMPAELKTVEQKRALVARRRANYERLEAECADRLTAAQTALNTCYATHGPPSKNAANKDPFFRLIVGSTGLVKEVVYFDGASSATKACLQETVGQFQFSPFADDEASTFYIVGMPHCRVAERDTLHDRHPVKAR